MRLKSLYIKDYKILQDFHINFTSNLSVLIGENGSGKSSIIECLAYIFGHLHKFFVLNDKTAEFISNKILSKISKRFNSGQDLKLAVNKLETINRNVNELVSLQAPYGEAEEKYDQLTKYLTKANTIADSRFSYGFTFPRPDQFR